MALEGAISKKSAQQSLAHGNLPQVLQAWWKRASTGKQPARALADGRAGGVIWTQHTVPRPALGDGLKQWLGCNLSAWLRKSAACPASQLHPSQQPDQEHAWRPAQPVVSTCRRLPALRGIKPVLKGVGARGTSSPGRWGSRCRTPTSQPCPVCASCALRCTLTCPGLATAAGLWSSCAGVPGRAAACLYRWPRVAHAGADFGLQ